MMICETCGKEHIRKGKYCSAKCAANNPSVIQKRKETCLKKYGTDNVSKLKEIGDKKRESFLKNDVNKIVEKRKRTCLIRYGVGSPTQLAEVKNKIKETCLKKYGSKSFLGSDKRKGIQLRKRLKKYEDIKNEFEFEGYKILSYPDPLYGDQIEFACPNEHVHKIYLHNWQRGFRCSLCSGKDGTSKPENDIAEILSEFFSIDRNDRKIIPPFELDMFIRERGIGIEYNGLYWHSERNGKGKNYHLVKLLCAEKQNIKLIQIFEDEWVYKREIVESILKNKLGLSSKIIYARNCKIKEIDSKLKNSFLEDNHLQGKDKSSIKLGCFFEDELVSVMTFGKRKLTSREPFWELIRFANKLNTKTIGGASKLFSFFLKNFNIPEIVSYADRRWSTGNLYENLGFKFQGYSSPNYWYIIGNKREHRIKYQKHKLYNILDKFNENLSEWENMKNNGYDRIWDCGNLVYKYNR